MHVSAEIRRKAVHIGSGAFALLLPFLTFGEAFALALVALAFNAVVLPGLGGSALLRKQEKERGWSLGILLYPASVALLIVLFRSRLDLVAVLWGILALGDAMASLLGERWGRRPLPWNPRKTWIGTGAYALFGWIGAMLLLGWYNAHVPIPLVPFPGAVWLTLAIAAFCAAVESWDTGVDDNLSVPVLGAGFLACLSLIYPFRVLAHLAGRLPESHPLIAGLWGSEGFWIGLLVNAGAAVAAYALRTITLSGAIGGILVGLPVFAFGGWRAFVVLLAFFIAGSAMTKLGYEEKAIRGIAQEQGGRRGARHALANCATGALLSFGVAGSGYPYLFYCGLVASYATGAFDTVSSEIGKAYGKSTWLPTTLQRVPPGTDGAVSLEGTLAGVAAGAALSMLGGLLGLLDVPGVTAAFLGAVVGTTFETFLGALRLDRGVDNDFLNFVNTVVGAASAIWIYQLLVR